MNNLFMRWRDWNKEEGIECVCGECVCVWNGGKKKREFKREKMGKGMRQGERRGEGWKDEGKGSHGNSLHGVTYHFQVLTFKFSIYMNTTEKHK